MKVVIVGSGNVAWVMADALSRSKHELVQVYSRNSIKAGEFSDEFGCDWGAVPAKLAKADLYIIAVADSAITDVTKGVDFGDAVVAHTAGSIEINALASSVANKAVLYPLQTFTKGRRLDLKQIPFIVEYSNQKAKKCIQEFCNSMAIESREMKYDKRLQVHLAAVFACNFTNHCYVIAEDLLAQQSLEFELLKPLIWETAKKAVESPSPKLVQSGPAVRNDFKTKSLHTSMLVEKPVLKNLYVNISQCIWETSKKK